MYNVPTKIRKLFVVLQYKTEKKNSRSLRSLGYIDIFFYAMPVAYRFHYHAVLYSLPKDCIIVPTKCISNVPTKIRKLFAVLQYKTEKFSRSLRSLGFIDLFVSTMPVAFRLHYHALIYSYPTNV